MSRAGFVGLICVVLVSIYAKFTLSQTVASELYVKQHKAVMKLRARVVDGKEVHLTFCKNAWFARKSNYDDLFKNILIYRRKVDFTCLKDTKEYFDGLVCSEADILYEGPVDCRQNKNFKYIDKSAVVGEIYAYWVSLSDGPATGPVAVKIRDSRIFWSMDKTAQAAYDLEKAYPGLVKVKPIGKTVMGRDILGLEIGKQNKKIALISGIHASEAGPEIIIPVLKSLLENHKDIFNHASIIAVPCMNMDQRQKVVEGAPWYLRTNMAFVDLNRNFPGDWEQVSYNYGCDSSCPDHVTYRGPTPGD